MARKLKTYQTSVGYDLAIAAPSMKAALEAWGAGSNLFHQGMATETDDPDVVAATMAKPGVVLRRPAGSSRRFAEHSDLPDLDVQTEEHRRGKSRPKPKTRPAAEISEKSAQKAAADFEREQRRREAERRREEAAREKGSEAARKGDGEGAGGSGQGRARACEEGGGPSGRSRSYREAVSSRGRALGKGKRAAASRAAADAGVDRQGALNHRNMELARGATRRQCHLPGSAPHRQHLVRHVQTGGFRP
jgi:colicin import membrane protein